MLLSAGLLASTAGAEAVKRKKPPQVQQDPMETESSPPPASPPPTPAPMPMGDQQPPDRPPAEHEGQSGGSGSRASRSSSGSSGSSKEAGEPAGGRGKAGPFMINVKVGPSLCLVPSGCPHQGAVVLDLGAALTPNRNGYLLLPVQVQFQPGVVAVIVPLGFQYDIKFPVRGLYAYPRISAGYAALVSDGSQPGIPGGVLHSGVVLPEFGLKYVLHGRWNFGGELVSLPLIFNYTGVQLYYRLALSAGVNF